MKYPRTMKLFTAIILCVFGTVGLRAEESLQSAYSAILNGNYKAGEVAVGHLKQEAASEQVSRLGDWLNSYEQVASSREELREKTFEWNIEKAKEQLQAAKDAARDNNAPAMRNKVYLALSFAAQASSYTSDEAAYAASDLVKELRPLALAEADKLAKQQRWAKAHMFYLLLNRIDEKDKEVEKLRKQAVRHARLELIYDNKEDVERRMQDVTEDLLSNSLKLIQENYFTKPDFRKMAEGALNNLNAVCNTTQLYEGDKAADDFDGLADPVAREYFLGKIEEERQKLEQRADFSDKDMLRLFNFVKEENKKSVSLPLPLLIIEFTEGAINEMDEFTSIIWPTDAADFDKLMVGDFVGVGIQLGLDDVSGRLKVVTPLENSPALEAGVRPDDLIVEVDGVTTKNWTTEKAVQEITGPEGTGVTLKIYRPATGEMLEFPLERRPIELTTVRGVDRIDSTHWNYMLDPDAGIAYLQLSNFNPKSAQELDDALKQAQDQGMQGLILDLRNNPGGLLDVAVGTVSEFIDKGQVVRTSGRAEPTHVLPVTGRVEYPDLPMVVLINEHSASASEILAGCLRDHKRALVLGERSFGKGSVQRVYGLDGRGWLFQKKPKARLKLTTALYYLPNGESPHKNPDAEKWGVEPDQMVELTPKEFLKVIENQRKTFIIQNGKSEQNKEIDEAKREQDLAALKAEDEPDEDADLLSDADIELLRDDPFEAPEVDPQLQTALLHLRVKLAAKVPWPQQEYAQNTQDSAPARTP